MNRYSVGRFILFGILAFLVGQAAPAISKAASKVSPLDFSGTTWDITLTPISDAKAKKRPKKDTLTFEKNTVIAQGFKREGYTPTNYSISVADDGTTTFQTMQLTPKQTAFWKGQVSPADKTTVSGLVTVSMTSGKSEEYVLEGTLSSGILETKAQKKAREEAEAAMPPAPAKTQK